VPATIAPYFLERSDRSPAAERHVPPSLKRVDNSQDAAVHPQGCGDQRSHRHEDVEGFDIPPLRHKASSPATKSFVVSESLTGCWIEAFALPNSVTLDLETQHKEWRKCIGELHDTESGDEAGKGTVLAVSG
jgi:hypothetical protein